MDNGMKPGIYMIVNIVNGKVYIGRTTNPLINRVNRHISDLNSNNHDNEHLQRAWNSYGELNFDFKILQTLEEHELKDIDIIEGKYIEQYNSADMDYGYNKRSFSNGSVRLSEETRKRIGESQKGIPKNLSKEGKENHKRIMGEKNGGENHWNYGGKQSKETKNKIRNKLKGKKRPQEVLDKLRKLTLEQCFEIKQLLLSNIETPLMQLYKEIGFKYNTNEGEIRSIKCGRHWSTKDLNGGFKEWKKNNQND